MTKYYSQALWERKEGKNACRPLIKWVPKHEADKEIRRLKKLIKLK